MRDAGRTGSMSRSISSKDSPPPQPTSVREADIAAASTIFFMMIPKTPLI